MLCFSVDNPDSLSNITEKWVPEVKYFCPKIPIILVGNKTDLRNDTDTVEELAKNKLKPVSTQEGLTVAHMVGAVSYIECSARKNVGVREVFEAAAKASLLKKKKCPKFKCKIM